MRSQILVVLVISLSMILAACGGADSTNPPETTPAPVTITISTNPNPPIVGDVELQFTVVDMNGQPVSGANFDVIADHTEMNGMTMHGVATEQGKGRYAINTNFTMPGKWKLTVEVRNAELDRTQDIDISVLPLTSTPRLHRLKGV